MRDEYIYGYGIQLDNLFIDLDLQETGLNYVIKQICAKFFDSADQASITSTVNQINKSLVKQGLPELVYNTQIDIMDIHSYLYFEAQMPYEKSYSKSDLTEALKSAVATIFWQEYQANISQINDKNQRAENDSDFMFTKSLFTKQVKENIPLDKIGILDTSTIWS